MIVDASIEEAPLIIVLEEVDILINNIHESTVRQNKDVPTSVHDKTTWSSFLDDMIFYKRLIVIMTSNTSKESIDALDTSYLREGRIHANYTMPNKLSIFN